MACRAATGFVYHDLDFSQPTPMGFAQCRRCGGFFTMAQYVEWRCEGAIVESTFVPRLLGSVPCSLCGEPVFVDPMHRAVMEWFGATCNACFDGVEAVR